jgi:uncharacterized protein YkwD
MRCSGVAVLLIGVCFTRAGEPAKLELSKEERTLLELTNAERKKKELPPLKPSPLLFKVARAHAANMAKHEKMAHDLDDKNPFQRLKEAGYKYAFAGENVAAGLDDLAEIMKGWMESEFHRKNILSEKFTEIGLGIARDKKGEPYLAQVFGKPR